MPDFPECCDPVELLDLSGRKGLVIGIANERSLAWPAALLLGWAVTAPWWRLGSAASRAPSEAAANATAPATTATDGESEAQPRTRRGRYGVLLELRVPSVHLAAIGVAFLAAAERVRAFRWTTLLLLLGRLGLTVGRV